MGVKKMMKKLLSILLLSLVVALVSVNTASAANVEIKDVEINGVDVLENTSLTNDVPNIERESRIPVRVQLKGLESSDVKVKAWIGGYRYDDIEDQTQLFRVEQGVTYTKALTLEIPEDIDASKDYTLHVEVFDGDDRVEQKFVVRVKELLNNLNVFDAVFTPGLSVNAGDNLFVKALIENLGDQKERKVKVLASVPKLGIGDAVFIDELVVERLDNDDTSSHEVTDTLLLQIPENAAPGNYDLLLTVESQRGREINSEKFTLTVGAGSTLGAQDLIVNPDFVSQTVEPGKGVAYKVSLTNLANNARTFTVSAFAPGLGDVRVDPSTLTLQADGTGEATVFVATTKNSAAGQNSFTVKVMENGNTVKELSLKAVVAGNAGGDSVRNGLLIALIILVIVLVVLGLIVAITKMRENEPESAEGQTYY